MNKAMKGAFRFENAGVQDVQSRFMFGEGRQHFVFEDGCDMGEVAFHMVKVVRHRLVFGGQHFLPMAERFNDRLRFIRALIQQVDSLGKRGRLLVQLSDLVFDSAHAFVELGDLMFDSAHAFVELGDLMFDSAHAFVEMSNLVLKVACPLIQLSELLLKGACSFVKLCDLAFENARALIQLGHLSFKSTCSFIELGHLPLQGANPLLERFDRRARRFHFMQNFPQQRFHSFHLLFPSILQKTRADGEKK
jgi:hypothetical protein